MGELINALLTLEFAEIKPRVGTPFSPHHHLSVIAVEASALFMPSSKPKDATAHRQTTLFDVVDSSKAAGKSNPTRSTRGTKKTSSPKGKEAHDDSDYEELAGIRFTPATAPTPPIRDDHESDEDEAPPKPLRRKRLLRNSVLDSDSEQPLKKKAGRRLLVQSSDEEVQEDRPRKKTRLQRSHQSDNITSSDDDVADLAHEVDENHILDSRLRERNKGKTKFQRNLEILKRRKLKLSAEIDMKDATDTDEASAIDDADESSVKPIKGSKPSGDYDDDADDASTDSESNFIVEDDSGPAIQLPPEFSMETHENIAHQFKKIFQFFVHVTVQPPEARASYMESKIQGEQYFSVPLQVMRRKLFGLRDSLAASSVWRPEFKRALERYPELEMVRLDFVVPSCDACHLGGRMSTILGRLTGTPYAASGFEPCSVEGDNPQEFHLGRFCARRTEVYHEFCHWEYDLFQNIAREIDSLRGGSSRAFHRIAYAGASEPPENLQDADGLCDWLDSRRVIETEWHKIKMMMDSARNLETDHKRGAVDD